MIMEAAREYSWAIYPTIIIANAKSSSVKRRFYNERRLLGFETVAGGKFYGTVER
jgi:hypothetical protein